MKVHHGLGGQRRRMRRLLAAVLGTSVVLGGAMCGALGSGAVAASDASGSTLRVAADTSITTFNPFLSYYDGELAVIGNIYPSLERLDAKGQPVPYLASSYTTSPDKLTWTFHLKSGLKWSDGTPLTAHDAAWTFNLIMHNSTAATANGSLVANFASVTAPDDNTLVIKTKQPQANMLYVSVPISGIAIVPQHVWQGKVAGLKNYKNMDFPVVGYGPWKLVGNVTNQYATLKANKNFFLGAPKFDTLITQYFSNSDAAVAALRSGQLDQLGGVTATQFGTLQSAKNIEAYQQASSGWTAMEVNSGAQTKSGKPIGTGNPILKDATVRQAIALAINRPELVKKILDGRGISGAGYLPPGYPQWSWKPSAGESLAYNPAKANQMLDAAGYKKGADGIRTDPRTGKPLTFRLGIHSDDTGDAQIAPYLQEWLQAVGIGIKVEPMSFDQLNVNLSKGDWDMLMDGWGTGPDPTYLLSIQTCATLPNDDLTGGNTDAFYCNPAYDKLFNKQVTQFDQGQRSATVAQMQDILYKANADIILYYKNGLSAVRTDKVSNYLAGAKDAAGFYPLQNIFNSWRSATPVVAGASGSSSTALWVGIVIAVILLAGVALVVVLRRRSSARWRE
jgi:peptide/nickel transport system substrate-binding protein